MGPRKRSSMAKLSTATAAAIDKILEEEEVALLMRTNIDWEKLRPKVTAPKTYDKLIAAVQESTAANESVAELHERLKALGGRAAALVKNILHEVAGVG